MFATKNEYGLNKSEQVEKLFFTKSAIKLCDMPD